MIATSDKGLLGVVYNFKEKNMYDFYCTYPRAVVGLAYPEQNIAGQINLRPLRLPLMFSLSLKKL